jgi:hypothetical protein
MQVVSDVKGVTLAEFAHSVIESWSKISSDAYRSYLKLAKEGYEHEPKDFDPKQIPTI